jgi:DNA-binding protein HU-beta
MNKGELVAAIAAKAEISKAAAAKGLDAALDVIAEELKKGGDLQLIGFASLKVVEKPAHKGINPATKAIIDIPAKKAVKFKAGAKLAL